MTNLCTDEIVFFRNLTKMGTDENKAIHSIYPFQSSSAYFAVGQGMTWN